MTKTIIPKFCLGSFNGWVRKGFVNFWSFFHSKVPSFSSWLCWECVRLRHFGYFESHLMLPASSWCTGNLCCTLLGGVLHWEFVIFYVIFFKQSLQITIQAQPVWTADSYGGYSWCLTLQKHRFPQTVWETALPLENKSPALILRGSLVETHLIPTAWQEGWGVILIFFPTLIHLWLFLPAPCLPAALQASTCSSWPTWELIQFSCNKQILAKTIFIFTCLIVFVHLFYCILCFTHDLGMQLSSTAYAAQRQFPCECGTVF